MFKSLVLGNGGVCDGSCCVRLFKAPGFVNLGTDKAPQAVEVFLGYTQSFSVQLEVYRRHQKLVCLPGGLSVCLLFACFLVVCMLVCIFCTACCVIGFMFFYIFVVFSAYFCLFVKIYAYRCFVRKREQESRLQLCVGVNTILHYFQPYLLGWMITGFDTF